MDEAKRKLVQSWLTKASHDLAAARFLRSPAERYSMWRFIIVSKRPKRR